MMNAIKFFKLDLGVMRDSLKYYVIIPLICLLFFFGDSPVMGITYLLFFQVIFAPAPFSHESLKKCNKFYYMLPAKLSSMVLGRYLYLISSLVIVWGIVGGLMVYFYQKTMITGLEIIVISFTGLLATIICFCQYPLYYKFGMEKGKALSMLLYMIPAFIIFALPSLLNDTDLLKLGFLKSIIDYTWNHLNLILVSGTVIIILLGYSSYRMSCAICQRKEI